MEPVQIVFPQAFIKLVVIIIVVQTGGVIKVPIMRIGEGDRLSAPLQANGGGGMVYFCSGVIQTVRVVTAVEAFSNSTTEISSSGTPNFSEAN